MTAIAAITPKERVWEACREKRCCSYYVVFLTSHDMVRVSRKLELPPIVFTRLVAAPADVPDGFRLDDSGSAYQMILAKQPQSPDGLAACTFLCRLPGGHAICGLGIERPAMCRAYPFVLYGSLLGVAESSGCTCRTWALAQIDSATELTLARRVEAERAEHRTAVSEWNRHVGASGRRHSYAEYCEYLIGWHAAKVRGDRAATYNTENV